MEMAERYYEGVGRRKTATARVRLHTDGDYAIIVNGKPVEEYFSRQRDVLHLLEPLEATDTVGDFRITVQVKGGGISGQAGAVRHGLARALAEANPDLRSILRKGGFLTRDARMKERKKPYLRKARKAPQYTKR